MSETAYAAVQLVAVSTFRQVFGSSNSRTIEHATPRRNPNGLRNWPDVKADTSPSQRTLEAPSASVTASAPLIAVAASGSPVALPPARMLSTEVLRPTDIV